MSRLGLPFRDALGQFATGVTVVTTLAENRCPVGVTANSFTSVSLDPPLILWNLRRESRHFSIFAGAKGFVVNVLSDTQRDIAMRFAKPSEDRFRDIPWHEGAFGEPIIDDALATFQCDRVAQYPGGDHGIFVGRVLSFQTGHGRPLLFFKGGYSELSENRDPRCSHTRLPPCPDQ